MFSFDTVFKICRYHMIWGDKIWYDIISYDMIRYGMISCGMHRWLVQLIYDINKYLYKT